MAAIEQLKQTHPDFVTKRIAPAGPVVLDREHPLYEALDELYLPVGNQMVAMKHGEHATTTGTTLGIDRNGKHIARSDTDAIDAGAAVNVNSSGYDVSVVTYYKTTDNSHTIASRRDSSTVQWQFYVFSAAPSVTWRIGSTLNDMVTAFVGSSWYDGEPKVVGISVDSSNAYLYKDGIEEDSTAVSGTASGTAVNLAIGNRWESYPTTGFGTDNGKFYIQMYFNRRLTASEQKSLSDDPFQLLKPVVPLYLFTPTVATPGGATPKGPFFHPFYGPFRGPIS